MGLGSETLKSRCWRSLPGPAHLLQASYPVLRVVAWQNDAAFPPLLPLVLRDDPQCLVLLAGFPPDPQHHPIAAPCLVLENHADSTLGQIDGGADEPSSLAFPPPAALQLQVIPDICSERKTPFYYFLQPLATSVSPPAKWLCSACKMGSHTGTLCMLMQLCHAAPCAAQAGHRVTHLPHQPPPSPWGGDQQQKVGKQKIDIIRS